MELKTIVVLATCIAGISAHPLDGVRAAEPFTAPAPVAAEPTDVPMPYNPGGPMIPASGADVPTTGTTTTLVSTTTLPQETQGGGRPPHATPTTPLRPGGGSPTGPPASDIKACTYTMNVTYSRLPTPPYWPQCAWDGTQTIYPATQTAFQQVDCKGCIDVQVHQTPIVHCPAMIINTTTSVATPTTQYMTVCSPTTAFSQIGGRGVAAVASPTINNVAPAAITSCLVPTTLWVSAALVGGPKSTVYQRMVTETQQVECHGCSLVVSIKLGGQGPLWKPTATMTSAIGTSTVYQCG